MSEQTRLFELALEAISVQANYVPGEGWQVQIAARRQGDPWGSAPWEHYTRLSSEELFEVVTQELAGRLRLL